MRRLPPDAPVPTTTPAAAPAPTGGGARNPWLSAASGGGRGGGGGTKKRPGRNMGGTVSEDYDGLDDDDDGMVPSIAARTRGSIARRVDAARLLFRGTGVPDGPGAVGTDVREPALGAEPAWSEHIKQQYDVGDGSDERVAAVLDAIQHTEGELANAEIDDMHF